MLLLLALLAVLGAAHANLGDPYCFGDRDVIVHLFEWKWTDIQAECPNLAEWGYCAVQVSPPQEHTVMNDEYPWWQRYQPVSYQIDSRSGKEFQFRSMVDACNNVGVFIYVDAVIQHMTGGGSGIGSAGSQWNGNDQSYPGVPYKEGNFHGRNECFTNSGNIEDYSDRQQVRYCRLVALRDLKTGSDYVRDQLKSYMNKLIGWGVAGFRVDACKYIEPTDLENIYNGLNNLHTNWFPSGQRPFVYQEVSDLGGEAVGAGEYTGLARVTEFKYSTDIGKVFRKWDNLKLAYLKNFGEDWGFMAGTSALVFIDNHENQRGHAPGGDSIITHKDRKLYTMATAYELAWPYGMPRVMSSYHFTNTEAGPPSDGGGNTNDVDCNSTDWVCEHRWPEITHMVRFHNMVKNTPVEHWWDNGDNAIAFSRGDKGTILINNEDFNVTQTMSTGLPDGTYCNVITSNNNQGNCVGPTAQVAGGQVTLSVPNNWPIPIFAIHA